MTTKCRFCAESLAASGLCASYVTFGGNALEPHKENFAHIPEQAQGAMGDLTDDNARKIRARLLNQLNR